MYTDARMSGMIETQVQDPLLGKFDSRVHLRASLPATIAREGKLLYVA
jgi:hypothetical protein